jgi:hypothetical protein
VSAALKDNDIFDGKFGKVKSLSYVGDKLNYVLLVGLGNVAELESAKVETLGAKIHFIAKMLKAKSATINASHNFKEYGFWRIRCNYSIRI